MPTSPSMSACLGTRGSEMILETCLLMPVAASFVQDCGTADGGRGLSYSSSSGFLRRIVDSKIQG